MKHFTEIENFHFSRTCSRARAWRNDSGAYSDRYFPQLPDDEFQNFVNEAQTDMLTDDPQSGTEF